jgi:hypothetical protein
MSMHFDKMAEHQIKKAQTEGKLTNLKGEGKPLSKQRDPGSSLASGYRIMAEAGVVPKEIELRKLIDENRKVLKATTDQKIRKIIQKELMDLELKLAIEQDARRKYMGQ